MVSDLIFQCQHCHLTVSSVRSVPFGKGFAHTLRCGHLAFSPSSFETLRDANLYYEGLRQLEVYRADSLQDQRDAELISLREELETESALLERLETAIAKLQEMNRWKSFDKRKTAYEYQIDGVKFVEDSGINATIGDAMGLGKTIQAILVYRRNRAKLSPCILTVPASVIYQWTHELTEWIGPSISPFFITGSKDIIIPGFEIYILSHDLMARKGMLAKLMALNPQFVIVDEIHKFKELDAKRTDCLISLINDAEIPHKLFLSGTPIKNRANEYFVPLHLLDRENFSTLKRFEWNWLQPNEKGVYTRIAPWRMERFRAVTRRYIIRREKSEVLKNLPPLIRSTKRFDLTGIPQAIRDQYNHELDLLDCLLSGNRFSTIEGLGILTKLRRLEGIAKVQECANYVREFLENTEAEEKITIGVHHHAVRDLLASALSDYSPLRLSGEDNPQQKNWVVSQFTNDLNRRVLICNILAGGTGLNLQACSTCIILERQWSFADERQFEDRFHRDGQRSNVMADYLVAKNFVDDYFTEMVASKRGIFLETLNAEDPASMFDAASDGAFIKDLCEEVTKMRI